MKYIDTDKLIAEIEKKKKILVSKYNELAKHEVWRSANEDKIKINTISDILLLITSLQQEQPDYKEAVQLVFEEELIPFKDGNQWCFLLGHNIQEGICGFGDTILDAAIDFYKDYSTTRIHIGELKKTMEQPDVDLEKEINDKYSRDTSTLKTRVQYAKLAHHFYKLGLNARK